MMTTRKRRKDCTKCCHVTYLLFFWLFLIVCFVCSLLMSMDIWLLLTPILIIVVTIVKCLIIFCVGQHMAISCWPDCLWTTCCQSKLNQWSNCKPAYVTLSERKQSGNHLLLSTDVSRMISSLLSHDSCRTSVQMKTREI